MPCVFCGRSYHTSPSKAFCLGCLQLLVNVRVAERSDPEDTVRHLRPLVVRGSCGFCRQENCGCLCNLCGLEHADCACTATAILAHYGIGSGDSCRPPPLKQAENFT